MDLTKRQYILTPTSMEILYFLKHGKVTTTNFMYIIGFVNKLCLVVPFNSFITFAKNFVVFTSKSNVSQKYMKLAEELGEDMKDCAYDMSKPQQLTYLSNSDLMMYINKVTPLLKALNRVSKLEGEEKVKGVAMIRNTMTDETAYALKQLYINYIDTLIALQQLLIEKRVYFENAQLKFLPYKVPKLIPNIGDIFNILHSNQEIVIGDSDELVKSYKPCIRNDLGVALDNWIINSINDESLYNLSYAIKNEVNEEELFTGIYEHIHSPSYIDASFMDNEKEVDDYLALQDHRSNLMALSSYLKQSNNVMLDLT